MPTHIFHLSSFISHPSSFLRQQKNGGRNFACGMQEFRPPVRLTILPESAERVIADTPVCESTSADHGQSVNQ